MPNPAAPYDLVDNPTMLMGRLGFETPGASRLRAGMSGGYVQLPDGSYMRVRGPLDVGYTTSLFGGNLDAGLQYGPQDNYRAMLTYKRMFK
jgi:hypothetical protein